MHDVRARLPVGTVERDPEKGSACAIGDLDLPSLRHPCSKEALLREFRDGARRMEQNAIVKGQVDPVLVADHLFIRDKMEEKLDDDSCSGSSMAACL